MIQNSTHLRPADRACKNSGKCAWNSVSRPCLLLFVCCCCCADAMYLLGQCLITATESSHMSRESIVLHSLRAAAAVNLNNAQQFPPQVM